MCTVSPSEAITAATVEVGALDLDRFLAHAAENAPYAGIADVRHAPAGTPVWVQADEHSLEDVVTHVLRNADPYRPAGTAISLSRSLDRDGDGDGDMVALRIANLGPFIAEDRLDTIFEYGVSDGSVGHNGEGRDQGLFVARTYLAKMGGTITAANTEDGVAFTLRLPRATARTAP